MQNLKSKYIETIQGFVGIYYALVFTIHGNLLGRRGFNGASCAFDARFEKLHSPSEYPEFIAELKIVLGKTEDWSTSRSCQVARLKIIEFMELLQYGHQAYTELNDKDPRKKMTAEANFWLFAAIAFEIAWDENGRFGYNYYKNHASQALKSKEGTRIFCNWLKKTTNNSTFDNERKAFLCQHGLDIEVKKLSIRLEEYMETMWPEENEGTTAEMIQGNPPFPQGIFPEQPVVKKDPIRIDWAKRGW